jgi:hypothetical protein
MSQVHPLARTTPRTRAEIKASSGSLSDVAERYNITVATARKWKGVTILKIARTGRTRCPPR